MDEFFEFNLVTWDGLRFVHYDYEDDKYGDNSPLYQLYQDLKVSDPDLSLGCE